MRRPVNLYTSRPCALFDMRGKIKFSGSWGEIGVIETDTLLPIIIRQIHVGFFRWNAVISVYLLDFLRLVISTML